jgi:hypothetical protein
MSLEIEEKLSNSKFSSGALCRFFKLDEKWGLKFYEHKEDRDDAWEKHQQFLKHNLAPEIGSKVDLEAGYGYTCEIVEILCQSEDIYPFNYFDHYDYSNYTYETWHERRIKIETSLKEKFGEMLEDFHNKIYKLNLSYIDDHFGNFGLKNGELVAIDFA